MSEAVAASTVPRRQLGRELRRLREAAGMTAEEAARRLEVGRPTIWRMEAGKPGVRYRSMFIENMCHLYGAPDKLTQALVGLAKETKNNGWWHAYGDVIPDWFQVYVSLEAASSSIREYQSELISGLLQTADYAAEVIRADANGTADETEIQRRVTVRMERQSLLTRVNPSAPEVDVVLNEAVLRRPVGHPQLMAEQLTHLAEAAELSNVTVRVLPYSAGLHRGVMSGPFVVLDFPKTGGGEPPTVYKEGLTGSLYLDKPHELRRYEETFDNISKRALDADASRAMIQATSEEYR